MNNHFSFKVEDPVAKVIPELNNGMIFWGVNLGVHGVTSPKIFPK